MKKTKFLKEIKRQDLEFQSIKFLYWLKTKLSVGAEKRKTAQFQYSIFHNDMLFRARKNSLPNSTYYKPTDIVLYDLIQKQDLNLLKKGLFTLYKRNMSHKFMGGDRSPSDIVSMIDNLDSTISSGHSWYRMGIFDFADSSTKETYIHHFEICIHNFSSSYAAIEMKINLSDAFQKELEEFIAQDYIKPGKRIHRRWGSNSKKTGGKTAYATSCGFSDETAKAVIIYEQLQYVKTLFLKEIGKSLPLLQYSKHKTLYGINVFETNIDSAATDSLTRETIRSLGISDFSGFYLSPAERLYYSTELNSHDSSYESDMMFIFNPNKINDWNGYIKPQNKAIYNLTNDYMSSLYTALILKNLCINYSNGISHFRNLTNKVTMNKKAYKKLLQLKYQLENDFYAYNKIDHELNVCEASDKITKVLEDNEISKRSIAYSFHPYENYAGIPKYRWTLIKTNRDDLMLDLNNKIAISSNLNTFFDAKRNSILSALQLSIAIGTFMLIVFPDKITVLADFITEIYNNITASWDSFAFFLKDIFS